VIYRTCSSASTAVVLDSDVGPEVQLVALVVFSFSFVAFLQAMLALVGLLTAPSATRAGRHRFYRWFGSNQCLGVTELSTLTGTYLVIQGISRV
jgi:hypothetical protein